MRARVSNLETFRRWRLDDEAGNLLDLINQPETERMRVGTAFHHGMEQFSLVGVDVKDFRSDGITFRFDCDIEIPDLQIKEMRLGKWYGDLFVSGQIDGMNGTIIYDHKTTAIFSAENYLDGYQWRYYMDIFYADVFRWNVFVIAADKEPDTYIIRAFHTLEARRYAGLHNDCLALAKDYYSVMKSIKQT